MDALAAGTITITRRPKGEAPQWVRKAWIGLTLPCYPVVGFPNGGLDQGVVSRASVERNDYEFTVPQAEAIHILEAAGRSEAATWWKSQGFPRADECFGFAEECVDPGSVKGVKRQILRPYDPRDHCGTADRDCG